MMYGALERSNVLTFQRSNAHWCTIALGLSRRRTRFLPGAKRCGARNRNNPNNDNNNNGFRVVVAHRWHRNL